MDKENLEQTISALDKKIEDGKNRLAAIKVEIENGDKDSYSMEFNSLKIDLAYLVGERASALVSLSLIDGELDL